MFPRPQRRWFSALLLVAAIVTTASLAGCTRAVIAPDGSSIYWVSQSVFGSQPPPQRLSTATLLSEPLPALSGRIQGGMIAPDGTIAYALLNDGNLVRAELPSGTTIGPSIPTGIGPIGNNVELAAMSPDGTTAIFGKTSTGGTLYRVDLATMTPSGSVNIATTEYFAETAAFTPDGAHIVVGLNSPPGGTAYGVRKVRVGNLSLVGDMVDLTSTGAGFIAGIILSPGGTTGYAVGDEAVIRFDVATMTITGEVRFPARLSIEGGTLMRSPDGSRLYFVDTIGSVPVLYTIDLASMRILDTHAVDDLPTPRTRVWGVLTPDGTTVFVGNRNGAAVRVPVATRHALAVNVTGRGSVRTSTGATCAATCTETLLDYETVTLTATADPSASFAGWGGACAGSSPTCTLSMEQARAVTATFVDDPAPLRLTIRSTKAQVTGTRIVFTTRLRVSEAGTISQRIVLRPQAGTRAARVVCRATKTVSRASTTTVTCRSTPATRRLLERRSLRVSVITTLSTEDGRTRQATRHLRLIRTGPEPTPPVTG